jgi:hypothetical protein
MRMSDRGIKQVNIQLAMMATFVLMFLPFLMFIISALFSPQPPGNRVFGGFVTCLVALLVLVSGRNLFFFAVHLKSATFLDNEVVVERFLAPEVRVSSLGAVRTIARVVPSWSAPYYQRGVLSQ